MQIAPDSIYTAITFAPVQGFIEKSRKLRDLYGSSFILSYLANALCDAAITHAHRQNRPINQPYEGYPVISPALITVTQGTPNLIVIAGDFPQADTQTAFNQAWSAIAQGCRSAIEAKLPDCNYYWRREWSLWESHTWELFWATGITVDNARHNLTEVKRQRNWIGVNWMGESSTLSGADAIAHPKMGEKSAVKRRNAQDTKTQIDEFYQQLSQCWGESIIDPRERLSIPELIKRLVTVNSIADKLLKVETPKSFQHLNRWKDDREPDEADRQTAKRWTGWFLGDGDRASNYLRTLSDIDLHHFSKAMREWGNYLKTSLPKSKQRLLTSHCRDLRPLNPPIWVTSSPNLQLKVPQNGGFRGLKGLERSDKGSLLHNSFKNKQRLDRDGRIIYAGGDDFLGVLYRNPPDEALNPGECLRWFYTFKSDIWNQHQQPITVSVGFVWAAPNVPQRDVLQHCREAEKSAKQNGRDRIALRILFNGGTHLEWVCPWWLFQPLLEGYRDRSNQQNWTHFYNDIAVLEARHAFQGNQTTVAFAILDVYFPQDLVNKLRSPSAWWNKPDYSGILGTFSEQLTQTQINNALNNWMINLAKIGFHLCQA